MQLSGTMLQNLLQLGMMSFLASVLQESWAKSLWKLVQSRQEFYKI